MKRIFLLIILLFITGLLISCNSSSSTDDDEIGYTDPEITTAKTLASKSYSFTDSSLLDCSSSQACGAIIYEGKLDKEYVGFAVGKDSTNPAFSLKIYWISSAIASINTSSYNISATVGGTTYTTASGALNITITPISDTYEIIFNSPITFGSYTINTNDKIYAYKYTD